MRLEPIEVEELSDPGDAVEVEHSDLRSIESVDGPSPNEDTTAGDSVSQQTESDPGLRRLRKPLAEIQISGLAAVSHPSFTTSTPRWITSRDPTGLQSANLNLAGTPISTHVSTYCRRPLYFEDARLERCGQSRGLFTSGPMTNIGSAARFLFDITFLPWRTKQLPPDELIQATAN